MTKRINVVGAVIVDSTSGHILCAQRGKGSLAGLWEFPGGKIEEGESPQAALEREINEELLCSISVGDFIVTTEHDYDFGTVILTTFLCTLEEGQPRLTEHMEVLWLPPEDMMTLDWAPADVPAVKLLQERQIGAS